MTLQLRDDNKGDRWRCGIRGCNAEKGLRKDNWLEGSQLPFETIVHFQYWWSYNEISTEFCEREFGMSRHSIVDWANFDREVCADSLLRNPAVIGGPGLTVEIDESQFSRRKNNVGSVFPAQWVFGGICRENRECFLFSVPDRSANTLLPIIQQHIRPGTTIMSDEWAAYRDIPNVPGNYNHLTVNHSQNFVNPLNNAHTQNVESMWNRAKAGNRSRWGTHRAMVDSYLCEFMWRQRLNGRDPFDVIWQDIVAFWPPQ